MTSGWPATPRSSGTASPRWRPTPTTPPIIVERAEGRELIDVDGRRYLDAISSLWVTTLGHRVPELDAALRDQLDRVAHSTMLGNGNRVVIELAEALAAVVPVDDPHFLFASDGAAAVEQALKIAFQYWVNQGVAGPHHATWPSAAPTTATPSARSRSAPAASAPTSSTRCASRSCGRPATTTRTASTTAAALVARARRRLAAVVIEPLVQGAAGMQLRRPAGRAPRWPRPAAAHDVLLICDEVATGFGRTGTLFAVRAVRPPARPAVPRQGHHRRLPADVRHRRRPSGSSTPSSAPT